MVQGVTDIKNDRVGKQNAEIGMDVPNARLQAAIEEGERIATDPNVKGYHSMQELREALEITE